MCIVIGDVWEGFDNTLPPSSLLHLLSVCSPLLCVMWQASRCPKGVGDANTHSLHPPPPFSMWPCLCIPPLDGGCHVFSPFMPRVCTTLLCANREI